MAANNSTASNKIEPESTNEMLADLRFSTVDNFYNLRALAMAAKALRGK